jgi:hypothetical protein
MHISAFVGVPMDHIVSLADGAHAEISDQGAVTVVQDAQHSITLTPTQMYELVVWAVEHHLTYLDFKAHELPQSQRCFECGEPTVAGMAYVYQLDEGEVEVCMFCHFHIAQTVAELQK